MDIFQTYLIKFKFSNELIEEFDGFNKFIDMLVEGEEFLGLLGDKLKTQFHEAYKRGHIISSDKIKISSLISDIRIYPLIKRCIQAPKKVSYEVIDLLYTHHKIKPEPDKKGKCDPNFHLTAFTELLDKKEQINKIIEKKDNSYFICKMKLQKENIIACCISNLDDDYYFKLYECC